MDFRYQSNSCRAVLCILDVTWLLPLKLWAFLCCFLSGSNMVWLYQWQLGVEMKSIKLSQLLGEIMWSGKLTFVNAGTKEWSHSINNSLPCYLYPVTTQSCCAETAFMAFKASLSHLLWTCYQHCSRSSCRHYGRSCHQHHCSRASCRHHGRSPFFCTFAHATYVSSFPQWTSW